MRHPKTKKMLQYWTGLWRESGSPRDQFGRMVWPERSLIQPMQCAELLGDMFILDVANGNHNYRLAGTRLCAAMGREMKGETFSKAFVEEDQNAAQNWATGLVSDEYAVLICSDGLSRDGRFLPMETLLLPLNHNGLRDQRALGFTVPLEIPDWLSLQPVQEMQIRSVRILRPWEDSSETVEPTSNLTPITAAPSLQVGFADITEEPHIHDKPLVDEKGAVRGAPHLRVLDGGLG